MREILQKAMLSPPERPSNDDIKEWKADPVTEYLFAELVASVLDQFSEDLPEDPQRALCLAFEREGARKVLDMLWQWGSVGDEDA